MNIESFSYLCLNHNKYYFMGKTIYIEFDTLDRGIWINKISDNVSSIPDAQLGDRIVLVFNAISDLTDIQSIHLVTLACFIEFLHYKKRYMVSLNNPDSPVVKFLLEVLDFKSYWAGNKNYVPAKDNSIFNLWRLVDSEKESHCQKVHDYLKQGLFKKKDLSAVKNSLLEVYYNVFDHAEANGNAFSLIKFDECSNKLHVAVCDFGKGIAKTVRDNVPEITDDATAIEQAMQVRFTIGSRNYNSGMGLNNILMACTEGDVLRIISNRGFMYAKRDSISVRENNFNFNGTLIYYELSLSHFDDEEIIDSFDLNF